MVGLLGCYEDLNIYSKLHGTVWEKKYDLIEILRESFWQRCEWANAESQGRNDVGWDQGVTVEVHYWTEAIKSAYRTESRASGSPVKL